MTDAYSKVTAYVYDGNGNKTSETDPLNRTTNYTYDNANRLTQVGYADNTTRSYTYDWRGNKATETDQLGRVTKYVYDLAGQLTIVTYAFGTADAATTSYTYDGNGRMLTASDPRRKTTTYTYDDAGRLTSVKDPLGRTTRYGYDAKGQRTSMTDAKIRVTTYGYDVRGRQLTTTTPDGKEVSKTYDGMGLVLTATDQENRTITFGYDAAGQLLSVTDALGQVTQYGYDSAGNKISQSDANGHTTSYAYDNLNRRSSRTLPVGQSESFAYDAVGNMLTRRDFNGKTTTYAYDGLNRLLSRTPDASFGASTVSFSYTATGRRATMTDASGVTSYTYTNRDRVAVKSTPQGALSYTYDTADHVISTMSSNPNGTNVSYDYDDAGQLKTVSDNLNGAVTNYVFDATGQLSSVQYPNGVSHAYGYDNRDRVTSLGVRGPSGVISNYTQAFNFSGRKQTTSESSGRTANYGYDAIYRLLNETISGDPAPVNNGALNYTLDAVGNRQSLASTLAALTSQSSTYDANDRISGDTFDANGNTLTSRGHTFRYDFEDRLTQYDTAVLMAYDGDGNRVARGESAATIRYLIDEQTPVGYPQVAEELLDGVVIRAYTYGPMRISQRLWTAGTNWQLSYYGYDGGGSVRQLTDLTGAVTDTYAYDAFGNTVAQTGTTFNEFLYRGEQFDSTSGIYYLRTRYYRPLAGRFLTQDKFEISYDPFCTCGGGRRVATEVRTLNLFAYAHGDPVNYIDPTGQADIFEYILPISRWVAYAARAESLSTPQQIIAASRLAVEIICRALLIVRTAAYLAEGLPVTTPPSYIPWIPPDFPWPDFPLRTYFSCLMLNRIPQWP